MSVGKYSPTVSRSYSQDQEWFEKNGGNFGNGIMPESQYDDQGYDSYGYNGYTDRDRAGYTESDYLCDSYDENQCGIYDRVRDLWDNAYSPTILELSESIKTKIGNDKLFAFNHAKLVTVINIHESAVTAKYALDSIFKDGGSAEGHKMYDAEFKAFFGELAKKILEQGVFLEDFYEAFIIDVVQSMRAFNK